jgi:hypothetical protein
MLLSELDPVGGVSAINLEENYGNQQDRAPYVDSISNVLKARIYVLMDTQTVVSRDAYVTQICRSRQKYWSWVERLTCAAGK